jgi:hypothetical protein
MEALLHVNELLGLALEQPVDRDTRPAGDDRGDVVLVDLLLHHGLELLLLPLGELVLERRQLAVADLGYTLQVAGALGALRVHAEVVDALRDLLDAVEVLFLLRPAGRELVAGRLGVRELALDRLSHVSRLLAHRGELDLELAHAPLRLVELDRRGVDLHAQAGGGFVDQVDRLVGQETVGDVAVGEHRRCDEGGVANPDAVVRLVALLQAAEDGDRVGDARLADEDGLETALERGVLLDVLAVLVERRRADGPELAAREHRLEHVRGVDGALGRPRPHDRVQLVDEEDDLALRVLDLAEDGLQPLLELAAVLGAGEESADVEGPDALALETLGDVPGNDPLREPLRDRRLPHTGVADQDGVVLRATREHLDHAADLLVAADHRVELAALGKLGEVAPELLERLVGALGVLRRDTLCSSDRLQGFEEGVAVDDVEREKQMLGRDELVLEPPHLLLGAIERLGERSGDPRLLRRTFDSGFRGEPRLGRRAKRRGRLPRTFAERAG